MGKCSQTTTVPTGVPVGEGSRPVVTPPPSNTGVQFTANVFELVDWVSGTLGDGEPVELWGSLLGVQPDQWEELPHGGLGYSRCKEACHCRVYYAGAPGMGSHVAISGEGCRDLEARGVVRDWREFAALLLDYGVKVTRLDVARDDRGGILDLHQLTELAELRQFTSRAHTWEPVQRYGRDRSLTRHGLNFGRRGSESYLRIYNKALESGEGLSWVRVELELKGKRAAAGMRAIAQTGLAWVAGALRSFLDFKREPIEGNRSRVPSLPSWDRFLSGAAKVVLAVERVVRTLEKLLYHLEHQWGPTIATAMFAKGGDATWFYDIARAGRHRMRKRHAELLPT